MKIKKGPGTRVPGRLRNWAVPIGCGLLFLFLLKSVLFVGYVPSASMEPTIRAGSLIFGFRISEKLECGDVIVFKHEGLLLVKRIAGRPSDVVYADGEMLTVPADCYYVLGDNADASIDSRDWAEPFVFASDIIAKVYIRG